MVMPDVGPLAELLQIPPEYYEYAVKQSIGTWRARKKDKERLEREHLKVTVARLHKLIINDESFAKKYHDHWKFN